MSLRKSVTGRSAALPRRSDYTKELRKDWTRLQHAGINLASLVGGTQRLPLLPDVPTAAEAGLPGYEATTWWGFLVPAKTPREVVARLNAEINKALADPGVKKKLEDMGVVVQPGTPEKFDAFIRAETRSGRG